MLKVLYIGDVMGKPGRETIAQHLPKLRQQHKIDLVIAQAENVSHGSSISNAHINELQKNGVDFFTGGNHTLKRKSVLSLLKNPNSPIIAPLNFPGVESEWGSKTIDIKSNKVRITSLVGDTFPEPVEGMKNPLNSIDDLLNKTDDKIHIINFHADFSSEKRVIGYYLDGRVSAVIGDHWHVPTADAMIFPKGTAHVTDVGMCGTLHSSLGVQKDVIISRWRDQANIRNEICDHKSRQFNAVLININTQTGLAKNIKPIQLLQQ